LLRRTPRQREGKLPEVSEDQAQPGQSGPQAPQSAGRSEQAGEPGLVAGVPGPSGTGEALGEGADPAEPAALRGDNERSDIDQQGE
jgi:hypothetical protein